MRETHPSPARGGYNLSNLKYHKMHTEHNAPRHDMLSAQPHTRWARRAAAAAVIPRALGAIYFSFSSGIAQAAHAQHSVGDHRRLPWRVGHSSVRERVWSKVPHNPLIHIPQTQIFLRPKRSHTRSHAVEYYFIIKWNWCAHARPIKYANSRMHVHCSSAHYAHTQ